MVGDLSNLWFGREQDFCFYLSDLWDIFAVTENSVMDSADSRSLWKMLPLWPNIQVEFIFHIQNLDSLTFIFRCAQPTVRTSQHGSDAFWSPRWKGKDPLWQYMRFQCVWTQGEGWSCVHPRDAVLWVCRGSGMGWTAFWQIPCAEVPALSPWEFRDRVLKEMMKLKWGHLSGF